MVRGEEDGECVLGRRGGGRVRSGLVLWSREVGRDMGRGGRRTS